MKVSEDLLTKNAIDSKKSKYNPTCFFIDHDLIHEYLKDYVMSISNLNTYLDCPRKFYFEEILKVPKAPSAHQGWASRYMKPLWLFFHALSQTDFDPSSLVTLFQTALKKNDGIFTRKNTRACTKWIFHTMPPVFKGISPFGRTLKI